MRKYSEEEKKEIYKKYNIKLKKCEDCGKEGALFRTFNKKVQCNECAHIAFLKFISVLSVILIIYLLI